MSDGSLAVGVLGVVLGALSLGWQAANYLLTGGRVRVNLRVGGLAPGGMLVSAPPSSLRVSCWEGLASQGFQRPIVAVRVANVGRQPVTVTGWGLRAGQTTLDPMADSIGPRLPYRLEVGEAETWAVDLANVQLFLHAVREAQPKREPLPGLLGRVEARAAGQTDGIVGEVELAAGRRPKQSRETLR